MEYRLLGRSGLKISALTLGTMTFGGEGFFAKAGNSSVAEARRIIDISRDAGINLLDTANVYSTGKSEEVIGEALEGGRKDVMIASKVRFPMGKGPNEAGLSRYHIIHECEASLRRLKRDVIDLYQVHEWDGLTPLEETMEALDTLLKQGKVRYIGCSNYSGWHIMKALGIAERAGSARFVSQQIYYSLQSRDAEYELLPITIDQGLGVLVWSPLAGGLLSGKYGREQPGEAGNRRVAFDFPPVDKERAWNVIDVMRPIAEARDVSVAQVALAWLLHQPQVTSVIIGAKRPEQLADNLAATRLVLAADELAALDAVSQLPSEYPGWMFERQGEIRRKQLGESRR
jgi:aryl-alcohol dehydrogenase-like predicted oxidoreductase